MFELKKRIVCAISLSLLVLLSQPVCAESVLVGEMSEITSEETIPLFDPEEDEDKGAEDNETSASTAEEEGAKKKSGSKKKTRKAKKASAEGESAGEASPAEESGEEGTSEDEPASEGTSADESSDAESGADVSSDAGSGADELSDAGSAADESTAGDAAVSEPSGTSSAEEAWPKSRPEEGTEEDTEEEDGVPSASSDGHAAWFRSWKMHLLDMKDAEKRAHKEKILRSRLRIELLSDGVEMGEDAAVYYVCDNDADYVVAETNGEHYIYQACITKSGEYFLASDTLNEAIVGHVMLMLDPSQHYSSQDFWNHVLLREAPQRAYRFSRDRPKDANGVLMVPYYNQGRGYYVNGTWLFDDWPVTTFNVNGHTMHEAGCGYFSTAMALSYVLQRIVSPVEFKENGQYIAGQGSLDTIGIVTAASYGVDAYITNDINEVLTALRNGQPVMEHVGSAPFTSDGHYILLVGVLPDGSIAVNDPGHMDNSYWYCGVSWPLEVIQGAVKNPATAYTVFG